MIIALMAALAGIGVPLAINLVRSAKADQILKLADTLRDACRRYWVDTDAAVSDFGQLYTSGLATWQGPYIDHPVSDKDNPTSGTLALTLFAANTFTAAGARTGGALTLGSIDLPLAQEIDRVWDVPAVANWQEQGRIEYNATDRTLSLMLWQNF